MIVKIDGQNANLGLEAYDYLGDPTGFAISQEKEMYIVTMEGGDAGGSYTIKWYFRYFKERSAWLPVKRLRISGEMRDLMKKPSIITRSTNRRLKQLSG